MISQRPALIPQAQTISSEAVAQAPSNQGLASVNTSEQAAGTATATARSYASATKKPFSPLSAPTTAAPAATVGGPVSVQHVEPESISLVNGKTAIPPVTPMVSAPIVANGSNAANFASGLGGHTRKPSVTISAAGASGYLPNGGPVGGKPPGGNGIQFGSINASASPAIAHSTPQLSQPGSSLSINSQSNPRITSPSVSPSPIPQPPASGGRPPSSLQSQGNPLSFGSLGGDEANMRQAGMSQGSLASAVQPGHLRRESSHSTQGDFSNQGMNPLGGRGGYPQQAGRGRGYNTYPQQMNYSPGPGYRTTSGPSRGGPTTAPAYQSQNRSLAPYPNSPHQAVRSPALAKSQPAHPQPGQMPMANQQMYHQHGGYPPYMAQAQVKPHSSSSHHHKQSHSRDKLGQGPFVPQTPFFPTADLSPASGNFENYLLTREQNHYGMPTAYYDPSFAYYQQQGLHQQMPFLPPSSPRPQSQMPQGPQQHYVPGQYSNPLQPQTMSRTPSAMSASDRPTSSVNQSQTTTTVPTPSVSHNAAASRHAISPAPKSATFQIPQRKKARIPIIDPTTLAAKSFEKAAASPTPPIKPPAIVSSTPTPPPRTPSHPDAHHQRAESKAGKTDEEKKNDMKDMVARKIEEEKQLKEETEAKVADDKKNADVAKLLQDKQEAEEKERAAAKAQMDAEEAAEKGKAEAEEAEKAAAKAEEEARKAQAEKDEEEEFARIEAEMERQEAEAEERYQKKKQADKEKARKEAEAAIQGDEDMKRAEREAEEAEEIRLKKLEESEGDDSKEQRLEMFGNLKKDMPATPSDDATERTLFEKTPNESGTTTPDIEVSVPTSSTQRPATGKKAPPPLVLETTKAIDPDQPSAALQSLRSARFLTSVNDVKYPPSIASPNPSLNINRGPNKFRYDKDFLLQFSTVYKEKPSEKWDNTVKETVGDTSETPSSRTSSTRLPATMGPRQLSNRPAAPHNFPMGTFGSGAARTLAPGSTSESRYRESTAGQRAAPPTSSMRMGELASFATRPGGPGYQMAMARTMEKSPSGPLVSHPQSPRDRNGSHRGPSGRNSKGPKPRESDKDAKLMPLTAGADLKPIQVTAGGWKPRTVGPNATGMAGPAPGGDGHMPPDMVQRKVKSNLNKMTPENFNKLSDQILEIAGQSRDETDGRTLRQIIQLTFEKATDEAHWAQMYANFCKRMLEFMSSDIKDESIIDKNGNVVVGGALFRKYLLNRCQEEFERGWKMNLPEKPEGESEEAVMLSDEYYVLAAAKRRGLGLVRFIGELYKLSMLTERIMHECVKKLVDYEGIPDEAEVESLTSLLKTIGQNLDSSERGHQMMDAYFKRIDAMVNTDGLPSRLKFMLMDTIDLRRKHWTGKGTAIKGPTTLEEVRAQAAAVEREKEVQRMQDAGSRRGGGGGGNRMPMGRGDARNVSGGGQYGMMPPPDYRGNTVGMDDIRRLGSRIASRQVSSQGTVFGPTSMFGSARGSNSRRGMGPSVASRANEDSGASSRTGTPPVQKEKKDKEEKEAAKSANAFSALAALDASGEPTDSASPPSAKSSPPIIKPQPDRQRPKSPLRDQPRDEDASAS